jgi:hypothetical protein
VSVALNEKRPGTFFIEYNMGCDYYIVKVLQIFYTETEYLEVEIDRERGYYDDLHIDEDADDYDDKIRAHMEDCLIPKVDPFVIYSNGAFHKSSCESKYKTLVDNELNKCGKSDILKIVKVEIRWER